MFGGAHRGPHRTGTPHGGLGTDAGDFAARETPGPARARGRVAGRPVDRARGGTGRPVDRGAGMLGRVPW